MRPYHGSGDSSPVSHRGGPDSATVLEPDTSCKLGEKKKLKYGTSTKKIPGDEQSDGRSGFPPSTSDFPCQDHSTGAPWPSIYLSITDAILSHHMTSLNNALKS